MTPRYRTAPRDRIPFLHKVVYGLGGFVNNLLAAAIGGMTIVLNLGLGMNPALVGLLGAIPRLSDAITDPVMGYISDHTRSRWGRRRPYLLVGAVLSGVTYALLWQLPVGRSESFYFWYFLCGSLLFYVAYTIFATPWVALGYELTPDYHERTRLMGVQNFIGQIVYLISPWFLWIMTNEAWFDDQIVGASVLGAVIGAIVVGLGILPAVFLRERLAAAAEPREAGPGTAGSPGIGHRVRDFLGGLRTTLSSGPFLKLCLATFLVFNGFMLVSSFQFYVIIYYVLGGDQALGARYAGYAGTVGALSTFVVIAVVTWLGTRIGKRHAFFIAIGVSMVGYALKWFCYDPEIPLLVVLPAPLIAFGLGGLFTLTGSMMADVVDRDELETRERREGMFGSIYWWVVKLGMAAALAGGGVLLNLTGFDVALGSAQSLRTVTLMRAFDAFIPVLASALAIWAVASYPITEESAHAVRLQLEQRRGAGPVPTQS
ncbi:MAG TPA: MFS transporter [Longimicrobiales bacterium]|nr:MFS transporter [Longimicrobiales bacterium]